MEVTIKFLAAYRRKGEVAFIQQKLQVERKFCRKVFHTVFFTANFGNIEDNQTFRLYKKQNSCN